MAQTQLSCTALALSCGSSPPYTWTWARFRVNPLVRVPRSGGGFCLPPTNQVSLQGKWVQNDECSGKPSADSALNLLFELGTRDGTGFTASARVPRSGGSAHRNLEPCGVDAFKSLDNALNLHVRSLTTCYRSITDTASRPRLEPQRPFPTVLPTDPLRVTGPAGPRLE